MICCLMLSSAVGLTLVITPWERSVMSLETWKICLSLMPASVHCQLQPKSTDVITVVGWMWEQRTRERHKTVEDRWREKKTDKKEEVSLREKKTIEDRKTLFLTHNSLNYLWEQPSPIISSYVIIRDNERLLLHSDAKIVFLLTNLSVTTKNANSI